MKDYTQGPRPGFWQMLWRTGGIVPLALGIFTLILTLISVGDLRDGLDFEANGVEVLAQVTDRSSERVRRNDEWKTEYHVTLSYPVDGVDQMVRSRVNRAQFEGSGIGSSRTIRYKSHDIGRIEFEVGENMASGRMLRWFALGMGVIALAALWWKGTKAVDAIRARKFGAIERVTVTDVLERRGKNSTSYTLQWSDKKGVLSTSLSSSSRERYDAYPNHTSIEIFRGAKGHPWWVGDVGPRADAPTVPSKGKP